MFFNPRQKRVATFLKGVWFLIAGVLLLGHTSVLAESTYVRVYKKGVVYYYFNGRESPQPKQAGMNIPAPRRAPSQSLPRPASSGGEALRPASIQCHMPPLSVQGAPGLGPIRPGPVDAWQVIKRPETQEHLWAGSRGLLGLLTQLGYRLPLVLPAYEAGSPRADRRQKVPSSQALQALGQEASEDFLKKYAQPQPAVLGHVKPGPNGFPEASPLPYSFPVSGPFSFRDTWGDWRSGGRHHRAVDIFAPEGTEVYAITAGVIDTLTALPEAGIILLMRGQDGRGYGYMHLQGYAPGIVAGKAVQTGELIGYVGRTGLVESAAHLHFQVYADHRLCRDELLNPYTFLVQLCHGVGVTDLYQHKFARLEEPETRGNRIQVSKVRERGSPRGVKAASILVIKNF